MPFILEESLLLIVGAVLVLVVLYALVNNSKWFNAFLKKLRFKSEEDLEEEKPHGKKRR